MANPHRGEVKLKAGEKAYTLRFSIDAICQLEEATGKNLVALMTEMSDAKRMSISAVRQLLHAALHEHHPEVSLIEAGELMMAAGGLLTSLAIVTDAMQAAFPEASGTPDPRNRAARRAAKSKAGTGPAS